jgi:hypothetical protein
MIINQPPEPGNLNLEQLEIKNNVFGRPWFNIENVSQESKKDYEDLKIKIHFLRSLIVFSGSFVFMYTGQFGTAFLSSRKMCNFC